MQNVRSLLSLKILLKILNGDEDRQLFGYSSDII